MQIRDLFERNIFRNINGVVKADQLDETSVWQELDEFVVTREMDQHLRRFFTMYSEALRHPNNPEISGKIGVWVSGFFGSGKSHFIKVLSYLLRNALHTHNGVARRAVEFFEGKITDAMLFGDIKRAVAAHSDVILFNIDSKAVHREGRDTILSVFLKVLNEMQGYSGDHPHIAHFERYLDQKGKFAAFQEAFRRISGDEWTTERDAYHFHRDNLVTALSETLGLSVESAEKWFDEAESGFALSVENFCKWVKEYLDRKGPAHRILFLVDEVGQFIGTDTHLMLNLQTITEDLGTVCQGRAWVVVTSQEDIDAVLGELRAGKGNDFSKIQGRFKTRLSLSSANVDEVIQSRLLTKQPAAVARLETLFAAKGDILKHQVTFANPGMTLKNFKDTDDFVKNYPFAPYQFQLVQKIFEAIRKAGATGLHLSRGERSILDAFQSAAQLVADRSAGILVPLYRFYPSIESFLDTAVKRTIDQAGDKGSLEPFDVELLKVLFLIRYVEEVKGNVENLVTLCLDEIDADKLALRHRIEAALLRLEKETLISRSGDVYFFLTNEERDINREIKQVVLTGNEESRLLCQIIFQDVLKEQKKYRFPKNGKDYTLNRQCDGLSEGNKQDGGLFVSVLSPLSDEYEKAIPSQCLLDSTLENGQVLIKLGNEVSLGREVRSYLQTDHYIRHKNDGTLPDATKRILRDLADDNLERRHRLMETLKQMFSEAEFFVAGQTLKPKAAGPGERLGEALFYLVENTFTKLSYLTDLTPDWLKELKAILHSNTIGQMTLGLQLQEKNPQALAEVRSYVTLTGLQNQQIVLYDMIEKRFSQRPFGWPEGEVLLLVARLMVANEIELKFDGEIILPEKAFEIMVNSAKQRKAVILKRQAVDPKVILQARNLGKELFHEMGPEGEDQLFPFLQKKLTAWQKALGEFKALAETGLYPGLGEITGGLDVIKKLVGISQSYQFIEQFNELKSELLDLGDDFADLKHFYEKQRPTWEKLHKSFARFEPNRSELNQDGKAAAALRRMEEILQAANPYHLVKEAEGLILTVHEVNERLLAEERNRAFFQVDALVVKLKWDIGQVGGTEGLSRNCLEPLETLRKEIESSSSLAHIAQTQTKALAAFDQAVRSIEAFALTKTPRHPEAEVQVPAPVIKKKKVVYPAKLVTVNYLETPEEVKQFLEKLTQELETALANHERIEIR